MHDSGHGIEEDMFKDVFKFYKRKKPPPDLGHVLQIDDPFQEGMQIPPCAISCKDQEDAQKIGLVSHSSWKIYSLKAHPGLLIILNPFTSQGQLEWIKTCLKEFPCASNKTNLASHGITLSDNTWWQLTCSSEGKKSGLRKKLRWVTLGYHHNWDTKEYSEDLHGDMPASLKKLCAVVSKVLGFSEFQAEAAIVNYYHQDSTLAPHTDHSEPYAEAPLFSFSFGQSAVFLIGGPTKATKPSAIYLHSGDVMVMTGPSRLAYHAVPRIVLVNEEPWRTELSKGKVCECKEDSELNQEKYVDRNKSTFAINSPEENVLKKGSLDKECRVKENSENMFNKQSNKSHERKIIDGLADDSDIHDILSYVKNNRINMNVRQVLMPSMDRLLR